MAARRFSMAISMYDFSIPVLTRGLTNLSAILDKAAAHAAAKKFDSIVLAQARLFPDMHPLLRQVQIACDTAKGAAARLAGIEVPKHEDTEVTFRRPQGADREDPGFSEDGHAGCDLKDAEGRRSKAQVPDHGTWKFTAVTLPDRLRAAELLLPPQHGLRAAAQERRRNLGKRDFLGAIQ
jgi:hypothetical protein